MTSKERIWTTLSHKEPDKIPIDFASTHVTGIHRTAYDDLAQKTGLELSKRYNFLRSGTADPNEDFLQKIGVDTRGVWPNKLGEEYWAVENWEDEKFFYLKDEWGATWSKEKDGGLYYNVIRCPMDEEELSIEELSQQYSYPVLDNDDKFAGMYEKAKAFDDAGYAIFVENPMCEVFHSQTRVRGYENFFSDLIIDPDLAVYMMDQTADILGAYYKRVLSELKDFPLIIRLSDDLGSQTSPLISMECYRTLVKPIHKRLIEQIKKDAKNDVKIFFHTDGAIKGFIPDLIEIGADILNPVQYSCTDIVLKDLKKEFGKDISFWGGGIDTQTSFRTATKDEIVDEIKRNIDDLATGGGFVFSQIHNFQKGTEPDKFWAVWDTINNNRNY